MFDEAMDTALFIERNHIDAPVLDLTIKKRGPRVRVVKRKKDYKKERVKSFFHFSISNRRKLLGK